MGLFDIFKRKTKKSEFSTLVERKDEIFSKLSKNDLALFPEDKLSKEEVQNLENEMQQIFEKMKQFISDEKNKEAEEYATKLVQDYKKAVEDEKNYKRWKELRDKKTESEKSVMDPESKARYLELIKKRIGEEDFEKRKAEIEERESKISKLTNEEELEFSYLNMTYDNLAANLTISRTMYRTELEVNSLGLAEKFLVVKKIQEEKNKRELEEEAKIKEELRKRIDGLKEKRNASNQKTNTATHNSDDFKNEITGPHNG